MSEKRPDLRQLISDLSPEFLRSIAYTPSGDHHMVTPKDYDDSVKLPGVITSALSSKINASLIVDLKKYTQRILEMHLNAISPPKIFAGMLRERKAGLELLGLGFDGRTPNDYLGAGFVISYNNYPFTTLGAIKNLNQSFANDPTINEINLYKALMQYFTDLQTNLLRTGGYEGTTRSCPAQYALAPALIKRTEDYLNFTLNSLQGQNSA